MTLPYCGAPPVPEVIWERFNPDPVLIGILLALGALHWRIAGERRGAALAGWGVAALALVSPLCALSVSLFAARVGQHMLLALVAAPLIALAWPGRHEDPAWRLGLGAGAFAVALWAWHLPGPYDATFRSDFLYWAMHVTLFGSAVLLWRGLLYHRPERTFAVLAVSAFTTVQMGLLGAVFTFVGRPLFPVHFATTEAWGLTPGEDQALGGLLMWVPGTLFLLIAAKRSLDGVLPKPARAAGG